MKIYFNRIFIIVTDANIKHNITWIKLINLNLCLKLYFMLKMNKVNERGDNE